MHQMAIRSQWNIPHLHGQEDLALISVFVYPKSGKGSNYRVRGMEKGAGDKRKRLAE